MGINALPIVVETLLASIREVPFRGQAKLLGKNFDLSICKSGSHYEARVNGVPFGDPVTTLQLATKQLRKRLLSLQEYWSFESCSKSKVDALLQGIGIPSKD